MLTGTLRTTQDEGSQLTIDYARYKAVFSVFAGIVFVWGVIGTLDAMENPVAGFASTTLTAFTFLILGLVVYRKNPTRLSITFCSMSLLFAVVLFNPPRLPPSVKPFTGALLTILLATTFAVVLDYCLNFPQPKKIIASHSWLRPAIYVIVGAFGVMVGTMFTTPATTPDRTLLLPLTFILIIGSYVLLSLVAMVHSYIKASAAERSATGLNLIGLVIGFGPLSVSILLVNINPSLVPSERFYDISLIVIPICLAIALMKLEPIPANVLAGIKVNPSAATRACEGAIASATPPLMASRLTDWAAARAREAAGSSRVFGTWAINSLRMQELFVSIVLIIIIAVGLLILTARPDRANRASSADVRSAAPLPQASEAPRAVPDSVGEPDKHSMSPVASEVPSIVRQNPQRSRTVADVVTPSRQAGQDLPLPTPTEKPGTGSTKAEQKVRLPEEIASSQQAFNRIVVVVRFENGRVTEVYVKNPRPAMQAYEATALQVARRRRYSNDASGMENVVVTVTSKQ